MTQAIAEAQLRLRQLRDARHAAEAFCYVHYIPHFPSLEEGLHMWIEKQQRSLEAEPGSPASIDAPPPTGETAP